MKPLILCLAALAATPALAGDTTPEALIATYSAEAGQPADPARGEALFLAETGGGKPDTPSCTTCHTADPTRAGQARTGKAIEPLAPRANPARFTDTAHVEKWFGRNCNSVLGRDCTAAEKSDIITWLTGL
ncbi:DUF1924 domain-containing protein [Pseudothioclava nitratireducens]|jgi:cytochrome c peroxidase|uniref:DUF1924 domain-containing protein n=1 Tax=Pseudothioclava nitratireducens TaxID=1928646 RepID=UPI0023DA0C35|nr:DUF1924 domain-containing protein [Defluviimonas nitratireducens]MDF1620138.1 DUF1924 domain-containing protein [Defluviimonas nitratireducens]